MRWWIGCVLALPLGCGPQVIVDDDAGDGESTADSASAEAGRTTPGRDEGGDDGSDPTISPSSGPDVDPPPEPLPIVAFYMREADRITLTFSTFQGAACPDPTPSFECLAFPQWTFDLHLRPMLEPGEYDLSGLDGFMWETAAGRVPGDDCSAGGGTFFGTGRLVIDSVGETITGGWSGADLGFLDVIPREFQFVAPLCEP